MCLSYIHDDNFSLISQRFFLPDSAFVGLECKKSQRFRCWQLGQVHIHIQVTAFHTVTHYSISLNFIQFFFPSKFCKRFQCKEEKKKQRKQTDFSYRPTSQSFGCNLKLLILHFYKSWESSQGCKNISKTAGCKTEFSLAIDEPKLEVWLELQSNQRWFTPRPPFGTCVHRSKMIKTGGSD